MGFTVDGFNQAKRDMASAFNKALDEVERLRKIAAEASSDDAAVAPAQFPETPVSAGASLADASLADADSLGKPIGKAAG